MAMTKFEILRDTDRKVIEALSKIGRQFADPSAPINIQLLQSYPHGLSVRLNAIESSKELAEIIAHDGSIIFSFTLGLKSIGSISVTRASGVDTVVVNINDSAPPHEVAPLLALIQSSLPPYERTESLDRLLGDELAEFYRRREAGLLRLENTAQRLIEQNEEYRRKVDESLSTARRELEAQFRAQGETLQSEYTSKEQVLQQKEAALEKRAGELDNRESRSARRQIRHDMKGELKDRAKVFTLTEKTTKKRTLIHALFFMLIAISGSIIISGLGTVNGDAENWTRHAGIAAAFVGLAITTIFYIKWVNAWFRQHADEEFRLKRLELDIDRASWVVELALEWRNEGQGEIPENLISPLTTNLFREGAPIPDLRHPYEDLGTALLSATSGVRLSVPGVGEMELDRRGMRQFRKAAMQNPPTDPSGQLK